MPDIFERLAEQLELECSAWEGGGRQAAVLVALTSEPEPRVVLGRRARHLRLHPGEIAFPGGKREPEDRSPWVTARREAREEIGLPVELVHPLGEFSPLVTRTGFEVHPCVARVPPELEMVVDAAEFDSVFLARLALFAERDRFRLSRFQDGEHSRMVPHYDLEGETVWGVTAAILAQLANVAYDAGLNLQRDWRRAP